MRPLLLLVALLFCPFSLLMITATNDSPSTSRQGYDPFTKQHYSISEASLREDPPLLLPDPDPSDLPPQLLKRLSRLVDSPMPSYFQFLNQSLIAFAEYGLNFTRYPWPSRLFIRRILVSIEPMQVAEVLGVAFLLSLFRILYERLLSDYFVRDLGMKLHPARKALESLWKAAFFGALWLSSLLTLYLRGMEDFHYPLKIFTNLRYFVGYFDAPIPLSYQRVYTFQLAFYLHSIWGLFFKDAKRSDSLVLCVHHVMTLLLLQFSLVLRLYRLGVLVVFLHDINDVFLELAKVCIYLSNRRDRSKAPYDLAANCLFAIFLGTWILTRLYWYPLKVLHATTWGIYINAVGREYRSFFFFNSMLWVLFGLHLYWFRYIMMMAFRITFKKNKNDIRETEVEGEEHSDDSVADDLNVADNIEPAVRTTTVNKVIDISSAVSNGVAGDHYHSIAQSTRSKKGE